VFRSLNSNPSVDRAAERTVEALGEPTGVVVIIDWARDRDPADRRAALNSGMDEILADYNELNASWNCASQANDPMRSCEWLSAATPLAPSQIWNQRWHPGNRESLRELLAPIKLIPQNRFGIQYQQGNRVFFPLRTSRDRDFCWSRPQSQCL
jgi:hypothetical protein